MRELVPFAVMLATRAGSPAEAVELAARLATDGARAIGAGGDDETAHVIGLACRLGIVNVTGAPMPVRCAELLVVCDVLAAVPEQPPVAPQEPRIVFTAPAGIDIDTAERLDLLVADVIRMSRRELAIGGPFWNEQGFDTMLPVLQPAVETRKVQATFYVHTPTEGARVEALEGWISQLSGGPVPLVKWYSGPLGSLMHAKFVVADRRRGYFGTANLTSLGFGHHIEMGAELTAGQSTRLCNFLDRLDAAGSFRDQRPSP